MFSHTRFGRPTLGKWLLALALLLWGGGGASLLVAGGSGLNVLVVVNQTSSNSLALGNYYCEQRQVPPENVLRISWAGGNTSWSREQFETHLLAPLLSLLTERQLTNQIDYVVLSMDIPFSVVEGNAANGTTSALYYGFKSYSSADLRNATNSFAGSEQVFRYARPASSPGYSFLATMITSDSLARAKQIVDQGRLSDATFPTQQIVLAKSSDPLRNVRYWAFDNAIFNARLGGRFALERMDSDSPLGKTNLAGYATGLASFSISPHAFVPGAMADSLTSFGGILFGYSGQTSLLAFMNAGAAASYGTVTEPQPAPEKFPDPQNYFYQTRGFSLAECYYLSLTNPYQGLVVGEPLGAPFARAGAGNWIGLATNSVLRGSTNLTVSFDSQSPKRFLHRVELFLNGKYLQTVTNLAPAAGNVLTVSIGGRDLNYIVASNATVTSIARDLANLLNDPLLAVSAGVHGDRISLQSLVGEPTPITEFVDHAAAQSAERSYQIIPLGSTPPRAAALGFNSNGRFLVQVDAPVGFPYTILASSDLQHWMPVYRRATGGPMVFEDAYAGHYSRRFYRLTDLPAETAPARLTGRGLDAAGRFRIYVEAGYGVPYVVQASTNLLTWANIRTNFTGGPMELMDAEATKHRQRYYRLGHITGKLQPRVTALGHDMTGAFRLRVDAAFDQAYALEASSNLVDWTSISTNAVGGLMEFAEPGAKEHSRRFYRVRTLGLVPSLSVAVTGKSSGGGNLLSIQNPLQIPFVILMSTNGTAWSPLFTNSSPKAMSLSVGSSSGSAGALHTHLRAAQDSFLNSCAHGLRQFRVSGTMQAGAYLRLTVTKTNGTQVVAAVTNHAGSGNILTNVQMLVDQINAAASLLGEDGLVAEDLVSSAFGAAVFNLRARSAGLAAAGITATLNGSPNFVITPTGNNSLTSNVQDLRPRNHIYVMTGENRLTANFTLATTNLADGFHELTVVAYEGNSVQTQTRATLPVRIQNTSLNASLSLMGVVESMPISGILRLAVTANTQTVTNISLYSTGGLLSSASGVSSHEFSVPGAALGVGLHPFYAIVRTTSGAAYRTPVVQVRFTP